MGHPDLRRQLRPRLRGARPGAVGEALYARAETTLVAYDFTTAKPRRLRPREREVLKGVAGEPVPFRWRQRAAK